MENNEIKEIKYKINKTNPAHTMNMRMKIIVAVAVLFVLTIMVSVTTLVVRIAEKDKLTPSKYVTIHYSGANGYASANCMIDSDKIYKTLSDGQKDEQKLTLYRELADSFTAQVEESDISNGNKITVDVTYNQEVAAAAGITVLQSNYKTRASGIGNGIKLNLFENVSILFSGISPDAYATVTNSWEDSYLATLNFSVDKTADISNGDTVTVTCEADGKELARHGYVAETTSASYTVDGLSSYVSDSSQINHDVLNDIVKEASDTIASQTADTTFRMLYKATQNSTYLHEQNDESASDIKLLHAYFLKKKDTAASTTQISSDKTADNYLYLVFKATVTNASESAEIYFSFEYTGGYITKDGEFNIEHQKPENRYSCSENLDKLYTDLIKSKENAYNVANVQ